MPVVPEQPRLGRGTLEEPLNHEYPVQDLVSSFLTPPELAYHRNHGPIPDEISPSKHTLTIPSTTTTTTSSTASPLILTPHQLATDYPQHTVTCALQCAGNRRHTMRTRLKEVQGIDWFDGAVMNCRWEGPLVRDVLLRAGVVEKEGDAVRHGRRVGGGREEGEEGGESLSSVYQGLHVQFACHLTPTQDDDWYGGSIELSRAMDPEMEVILALKMNDLPLPHAHGSPVRAIVPGILGARSVKWLDTLTISEHGSPNHYQRRDYKVLPPEAVDAETAERYWDVVDAMGEMGANSAVAVAQEKSNAEGSTDGEEMVLAVVRGWAVPGGSGGPITCVEVSGDDGRTWVGTEIINRVDTGRDHSREDRNGSSSRGGAAAAGKWSWVLWHCSLPIERKKPKDSGGTGPRNQQAEEEKEEQPKTILSRAFDAAGNQQPRLSAWNLRGVGYNGFGELRLE